MAYDLAISRTLLFERVYLHHKTRAAERIALAILSSMKPCPHPADLLKHDDGLFTEYGRFAEPSLDLKLIRMFVRRQLPHRMYALSYGFLAQQAVSDATGKPVLPDSIRLAWQTLEERLKDSQKRTRMEQRITDLIVHFSQILGHGKPELRVWLDTPPSFGRTVPELLIERPDGSVHLGESFPANAAAFAQSPHAIFFAYLSGGTQRDRELGYIATEMTIAELGLPIGRLAADHAKVNLSEVEGHKRELEDRKSDVFSQFGQLRPSSAAARLTANNVRIRELARRFHTYHMNDKDVRLDERRIKSFLDQFPERLVEPMLGALDHLLFLDRSALGNQFGELLRAGAGPNSVFSPLTKGPGKSADHLAYFLADSPSNLQTMNLDDALNRNGNITFFDESTLSGKQARTVIQIWFGLRLDLPEEAELTRALSDGERNRLKQLGVRFRFLYGLRSGIDSIKELTREVGLGEDVVAFSEERGFSRSLANVPDLALLDDLRAFLHDVGNQLHLTTNAVKNPTKWTPQLCQVRALGYSNLEQLLVVAYNTPTATLTALWKGGKYRNTDWLPLFPRRGEKSSPVLFEE